MPELLPSSLLDDQDASWTPPLVLFLIAAALHAALGLVIRHTPIMGALQAWLALIIGIFVAWKGNLRSITCICAYLAGSELMWRMSKVPIFWEFGKGAIIIILLSVILRKSLFMRGGVAPLYFLLLIPSALLTMANVQLEWARQEISGNMAGPLLLMIAVWVYRNARWNSRDLTLIGLFIIVPLITASVVGVNNIATTEIKFGTQSNFGASGGFGPNQVSTGLSLGAFTCFLLLCLSPGNANPVFMAVMAAGMIGFTAHSAITFSRGGLYSLAAGLFGAFWFLLATPRARLRLVLGMVAFVVIGGFYVLPRMDRFTQGQLMYRITDTEPTGRFLLMKSEWDMFTRFPLLGVGPGKTILLVQGYEVAKVAGHTEYTRLLAEHGIFGLGALLLMGVMALQNFFRQRNAPGRAICVGLMLWSAMTMMHAATRLAMTCFIFGLASALFVADKPDAPPPEKKKT
jgi:hypothetical protein